MDRLVFLVDMNAFYISCETLRDPTLKGKPAAVAGDPKKRTGIILAGNYEARAFGVRTAMSVAQALKLCPNLTLVPPDHDYYSRVSRNVMDLLDRFSPTIEQNSIDEAWLDMSGSQKLFGSPLEAAGTIQSTLEKELGLWCSIGISNNKFLAKMAAEMKKPLGITTLFPEELEEKCWPMPLEKTYGVGQKTAEKLHHLGLFTIGDLARSDPNLLGKTLGKTGPLLHQWVNGQDQDPVMAHHRDDVKSIGKSVTLSEDLTHLALGKEILFSLSDQVGRRARRQKKKGTTVQITIKYSDFRSITRQHTIPPTDSSRTIFATASRLLEENWSSKKPVRLLGVTLTDFNRVQSEQLSMLASLSESIQEDPRIRSLEETMDRIRDKYGSKSMLHGIQLKKRNSK